MARRWRLSVSRVLRVSSAAMVCSLAAYGLAVPTPAAAAAPVVAAAVSVPTSAADVLGAAAAARQSGRAVEVADRTSSTSVTSVNPDGTLTTSLSTVPVRVARGDGWVPVDTTLVADAAGVHPRASAAQVQLSAGGNDQAVTVPVGAAGRSLVLRWLSSLPRPSLSGATATYTGVLPGADLTVTSTPAGFELSLVLRQRPASGVLPALRLPLTAAGLSASVNGAGALELRDTAGSVVASGGTPLMYGADVDAFGNPVHTARVAMSVEQGPAGQVLVLSPDAAFQADPAVLYPVVVDPAVAPFVAGRQQDTYTESGTSASSNYSTSTNLLFGARSAAGLLVASRSWLTFDTSSITGRHVLTASLSVFNNQSAECSGSRSAFLDRVDSAYNPAALTWNSGQPTVTTTVASSTASFGAAGCLSGGNITFSGTSLSSLVDGWVKGTTANYGLRIHGTETTTAAYRRLNSGESTSNTPTLTVTYNSYPGTVGGRSISPSVPNGSAYYVRSASPVLKGAASDPDGDTVKVNSEVWNAAGTVLVATGASPVGPSNTVQSWTVFDGLLADNTAYLWRAKGDDGTDTSLAWSSSVPFTVDTTAPGATTVTASNYPRDSWTAQTLDATFSLSSPVSGGSSDVASFSYRLDDGPTRSAGATTSGSLATASLPAQALGRPGWHVLHTQAVDRAGNVGANLDYAFGAVGAVTAPVSGNTATATTRLGAETGAGSNEVTFSYQLPGAGGAWTTIPAADAGIASWPVATVPSGHNGVAAPSLSWNVAKTLGALGVEAGTTVNIAAQFSNSGTLTTFTDVPGAQRTTLTWDPNGFGDHATTPIGPGSVDLLTGNFTVTDTDVSVPAYNTTLSVARTYHSRQTGGRGLTGRGTVPDLLTPNQRSAETDLTGLAAVNAQVVRSGSVATDGLSSLLVSPTGASTDSYGTFGCDYAMCNGLQAGHSYTFSTHVYVPTTMPLGTGPGIQQQPVLYFHTPTGGYTAVTSARPTRQGGWQSLTLDATIPADADQAFVRLYNGFAAGSGYDVYFDASSLTEAGIFGPGWNGTLDTGGSGWLGASDSGSAMSLLDTAGARHPFTRNGTGNASYTAVGDTAAESLTVTGVNPGAATGATSFTVTEPSGTKVTLASAEGAFSAAPSPGNPHTFNVVSVEQPGQSQSTSYTYDSAGNPTQILAPLPTPTTVCSSSRWDAGCRALQLAYTYGRVAAVTLKTYDPALPGVRSVLMSCYTYASTGRLAQQWDPRINGATTCDPATNSTALPVTYTYDSAARISVVSPTGEAAWNIGYDSQGRTSTVGRTHNATYGSGTENSTVAYAVNIGTASPADGSHPDLSPTAAATWGQADTPVTATAVYGPGDDTTALLDADVHALDADSREVNSATFSGTDQSGWKIGTTEYDERGNTIRTLSASNRQEALTLTAGDPALGLSSTDTASRARALDSRQLYAVNTSDGVSDLTDAYGPLHLVSVPSGPGSVAARAHTHTDYGTFTGQTPGGGSSLLTTDAPAHLPRQTMTGASLGPATEPAAADTDVRTSTMQYALSNAGTGTDDEGWLLKTPIKTTTLVPGAFDITRITRLDRTTGLTLKSQMPSDSAGTGVGTTVTAYYSPGADNPSACTSSAWTNLPCTSGPAASAAGTGVSDLPTTRYQYDYLLRPVTVTETVNGAPDRVSTTSYEQNGLSPRTASTVTTGGVGTAHPATTLHYDTAGRLDSTQYADSTGTLSTGYDDFGRTISSTDADGFTTTSSYDSHSRPAVVTGKQSLTFGYDTAGTNEHRGMLTSLTASDVSSTPFTGVYDADGKLTSQTYPDGLIRSTSYDETDRPALLRYTRGSTDVVTADSQLSNIHDQWTRHQGEATNANYTYDNAGRLTATDDTTPLTNNGACASRAYTYDVNSNRTQSTAYPNCTGTGGATTSHGYDSADRLLPTGSDTGLTYDAYGRITTLPAASSRQPTATTGAYWNTDQVQSLTQTVNTLPVTRNWNTDAAGRRRTLTDSSGPAKTSHYTGSSDNPTWIDEANSTYTTYTTGLGGDLAVSTTGTATSRTATVQLTNLHGDITTTQPLGGGALGAHLGADEFGNAYTTSTRYGWLGGKQRSADALGGVMLMGERLYAPALGRFLQTDPIKGGNANNYDYCTADPINCTDLNGRWGWHHHWRKWGQTAWRYASHAGRWTRHYVGRCIINYIACGSNVERALSPIIFAGFGVAIVYGFAGCVSFSFGFCLAAAPLVIGGAGGAFYGSWRGAKTFWRSRRSYEPL